MIIVIVYARYVNHHNFLGGHHMPMIDVYAPADLFPADSDRELAAELTLALLRAEGVPNPTPYHLNNTAAYVHRLPSAAVHTAANRLCAHGARAGLDASRRVQTRGSEAARRRGHRDRREYLG